MRAWYKLTVKEVVVIALSAGAVTAAWYWYFEWIRLVPYLVTCGSEG